MLLWLMLFLILPLVFAEHDPKIDSLLLQIETDISNQEKAGLMIQIASEYYYTNLPEAIRYASQAGDLYSLEKDTAGKGQSLNIVGAGYYALGNYEAARNNFLQALHIARQISDSVLMSKIFNNLGNIELNTGQLESAIDYFLEAGKIFAEKDNLTGAISVEISLSSIYRSVGSFNKSQAHLENALRYAEEIKDERLLGTVYHNLGALLMEEKKFDEAMQAALKSYSYRLNGNHLAGQIKSLINLGNIYRSQGNPVASDTCYNKALFLAEKNGFMEDQAYIQMHMGFNQLQKEEFNSAAECFHKSMDLANNLGDLELQVQLHDYLFFIDSIQGNFASALVHQQKYNQIKSRFSISESEKKLSELEGLFSLVKVENEIKEQIIQRNKSLILCLIAGIVVLVLLALVVIQQVLIRSQRRITELSQENLRSQINPHFIFNILNSIHSFLLRNDAQSSSNYLLKFSKLLRLTLDNSRCKLTSIQDELESLKIYLELESLRLKNQLEYEIIIDEEIDPVMFKIPPLLLQPFVENSIIHGLQNKEGAGKIEIRLDYTGKGIHCSITDNGIGRHRSESISKEREKHISYGSTITETRLQLLNSLYGRKIGVKYTDMTDEKDNSLGTRVEFNLPLLN